MKHDAPVQVEDSGVVDARDPAPEEALSGSVDRSSPVPYYYQLRQILERAVTSGSLPVGARLPSEPALCESYNVSRTVVRQALSDLERQGLLTREKGKGTFVAAPKQPEHLVRDLTGLYEDVAARGGMVETKTLRLEVAPVSAHAASRLGLVEGEPIVLLERLRVVDGEPLVVTTAHMPYDLCSPILDLDMTHRSLYATFENELGFKLHSGHRSIEASLARGEVARHLQVAEGAPLLVFTGVTYTTEGRPIEYFVGLHRGDRSRFEADLLRPDSSRSPATPPSDHVSSSF
jgi:GntR family transcriptional regulator